MNNHNRGFIVPLVLTIIILLLVGGGAYIYTQKKSENPPNAQSVPVASSTTQTASSETAISVPGMSKYTDSDFGFSFWYPTSLQVKTVPVQNPNLYEGGTIKKSLEVSKDQKTFTIEEFYSPSMTIKGETGCPGGNCFTIPIKYYFDASAHIWMTTDQGTSREKTIPATVAGNTMGGLSVFDIRSGSDGRLIPLNTHSFLIVGSRGGLSTPYLNPVYSFVDTFATTDPSATKPASLAQQKQKVIRAGLLFGAFGVAALNDTGQFKYWFIYDNGVYDNDGILVAVANAVLFKVIQNSAGFAADGTNVYYKNDDGSYVVKEADPATFTGIDWQFEKDKSHVWRSGTLIPDADPATFVTVIPTNKRAIASFKKDNAHVWFNGNAIFEIPSADPNTFIADDEFSAHDAQHRYEISGAFSAIPVVQIDGGAPIPLQ